MKDKKIDEIIKECKSKETYPIRRYDSNGKLIYFEDSDGYCRKTEYAAEGDWEKRECGLGEEWENKIDLHMRRPIKEKLILIIETLSIFVCIIGLVLVIIGEIINQMTLTNIGTWLIIQPLVIVLFSLTIKLIVCMWNER